MTLVRLADIHIAEDRSPPGKSRVSERMVQRITTQVARLAQATEGVFLRAGTSLEQAVERFDRLTTPLDALAAMADAGAFKAAVDESLLLESRARSFAEGSAGVLDRIIGLAAGSDRLQADLFAMRRVIRTMSIVALNARVTVASLAEQNTGLDVFTTAATSQVVEAGAIIDQILETVATMGQRISEARGESETLAHLLGTHLAQTLAGLRTDMIRFEAELSRSTEAGSLIVRHGEDFRRAITTAVIALQIGDATRQRLEHVVGILNDTAAQRNDEPAMACLVFALVAAQLRDAHERHAAAITTARAALRDAGQETLEIGRIAAHAASAPRHNLKHNLQRLQNILADCAVAQTRLVNVAEALSHGLAQVLVILDQMTGVEERMGMIGLNAVIACSQLGNEALALREISLQLRELAATSADRLRHITQGLADMGETAGRTGAELSGAFRGELDTLVLAGEQVFAALTGLEASILDTGDTVERERKLAERDVAAGISALSLHSAAFAEIDRLMPTLDRWAAGLSGHPPGEAVAGFMTALRQRYSMAAERTVHDSLMRTFLPHAEDLQIECHIAAPDDLESFFL